MQQRGLPQVLRAQLQALALQPADAIGHAARRPAVLPQHRLEEDLAQLGRGWGWDENGMGMACWEGTKKWCR